MHLSMRILGIKALPQIWRDDRAKVILAAEHAVADPRDKIVNNVAQSARDQAQDIGQKWPSSAEPLHDVERGIRAREQPSIAREDDEGVRQCGAQLGCDKRFYRFTLQRREPEGSS